MSANGSTPTDAHINVHSVTAGAEYPRNNAYLPKIEYNAYPTPEQSPVNIAVTGTDDICQDEPVKDTSIQPIKEAVAASIFRLVTGSRNKTKDSNMTNTGAVYNSTVATASEVSSIVLK